MSRINTNIPAVRAVHVLGANNRDLNIRLERLSTGLRINRGKDDPAGIIASETLRSEIRAISQAIDNSNRAINVLSTAEGALNEVSALLLDVRALLQSSANEGGLTSSEIDANQLEIDAILVSIDRIANTTSFGAKKLLNGRLGYTLSSIDSNKIASINTFGVRLPENDAQAVTVQVTQSAERAQLTFLGETLSTPTSIEFAGTLGSEIQSFASGTSIQTIAAAINTAIGATGISAVVSTAGGGAILINSTEYGSSQFVTIKTLTGSFVASAAGVTATDSGVDVTAFVNGQNTNADGLRIDVRSLGLDARLYLTESFATQISSTSYQVVDGGAKFQIASEVSSAGQVNIGLESVSTANLGNPIIGYLNSLKSGGRNEVRTQNFTAAERIVREAIGQIAFTRGRLGGVQRNQIETNINSQQIQLENVKASESVIRDADMAQEISALTRAQILVQSTQTTLQIANQQPQAVLQLLS